MSQRPLEARRSVRTARAKQPDAGTRASVRFRDATEADVPALVALINAAYEPVDFWLFEQLRTSEDDLRALLRDPEVMLIVAEAAGEIAGHIELSFHGGRAMFGLLAVALGVQGRGTGTLLVEEVERRARAAGHGTLWLECVRENRLEPYYESLGYRTVEADPGRLWGAREDWTLARMSKEL